MIRSVRTRLTSLGWPAWMASLAATAALGATLAYWILLLGAPSPPIGPARLAAAPPEATDTAAVSRMFGVAAAASSATAVAPPLAIQVTGIVAAGRRGSALLAVEGKPARAYAVGDAVTATARVRNVTADAVILDMGGGATASLPAPPRTPVSVLGTEPARPGGLSKP
jgi:general secretion pathway protein C